MKGLGCIRPRNKCYVHTVYVLWGSFTVSPKTTMVCFNMTVCQNELKQKFEYRAHQENISQKNIVCSCSELNSEVITKPVPASARKPYFEVYYLAITLLLHI